MRACSEKVKHIDDILLYILIAGIGVVFYKILIHVSRQWNLVELKDSIQSGGGVWGVCGIHMCIHQTTNRDTLTIYP